MKTCTVPDCGKGGQVRLGRCPMHYERWRKYGSLDPVRPSPACRFLALSEPLVGDPGCVIWTGALTPDGYGNFKVEGRTVFAHRYAYEQAHGPIPDGLVIDHTCWTPACVLVDHLRLATVTQNNQNRKGAYSVRKHDLPRGVYPSGRNFLAKVGRKRLGTFPTVDQATTAAATARLELFGEYAGK